ncbi:MAG: TetR/AcrR family transcriptional regulator, partial [Planctomycetia bacterium]|nr:TetR/AcrR family transcriptional regulator [Planctomycetia bacterium]
MPTVMYNTLQLAGDCRQVFNRKGNEMLEWSTVPQMPQTSRGMARYEKTLAVAHELFLKKGYVDTSMSEIVRAAGGSMTTAYQWFENKERLFVAVFLNALERTSRMIQTPTRVPSDWRDALELLLERLYDSSLCLLDQESRRTFLLEYLQVSTFRENSVPCLREYIFEPFCAELVMIAEKYALQFRLPVRQTALTLVQQSRCLLIEYLLRTVIWEDWKLTAIRQSMDLLLALTIYEEVHE